MQVTFIFTHDISQPGKHSSQTRQGNLILYPILCYNRIISVYKLIIFIVHFNRMFWVRFRMFLIFRVYGSFCANTLWIISILRLYGDFGVSKFILRFYRSCGRNDIVRFSRRTATQVHEHMREKQPWKFRKVFLQQSSPISQNVTLVLRTNLAKNYIFKEKHTNAQLTTHVRTSVVDGVPASTSTKTSVKNGTSPTRILQQIHSALAAQNCTAQKNTIPLVAQHQL